MIYFSLFMVSLLCSAEPIQKSRVSEEFSSGPAATPYRGIGQYGYPSDPIQDRAKGYLLSGKAKTAVTNYGTGIVPEDGVERADVESIRPGQTLVIARKLDSDIPFEGEEGIEYILWDNIRKMMGDDPISLRKNGVIIDQVGDEGEDPGWGWDVAGVDNATKDHTMVRKSGVTSGNTDWQESAGTGPEDSEWIVHDQNYFEDTFIHSCIPR